jgi:hypothetical protein
VAKALKLAAEAGIRNDIKAGQEVLQSTIDKINRETPKDEFCQKYSSPSSTSFSLPLPSSQLLTYY